MLKKPLLKYKFNCYKGTLIRIMRDSSSTESERKEASRLYMMRSITEPQESWINKFVRKYNKKDEK